MIDVTFDFRTDAGGKDPDGHSKKLSEYHRLLWSKPLPGGEMFDLETVYTYRYEHHHRSHLGEFRLSSDTVVPSWTRWWRARELMSQIPEAEKDTFNTLGYTIGAMMVWPGDRIAPGVHTINQARGCNKMIDDRFDLTAECVRRYYLGEWSPLGNTFGRYLEFFTLFRDFAGFVEFFHLQDIVDEAQQVRFFMPFDGFVADPHPTTVDGWRSYRDLATEFLQARNRRIAALPAAALAQD